MITGLETIVEQIKARLASPAPAAPAADAPAPRDERLQAVDKLRGTARWLIAAFAAVGTALASGTSLSNLGHVANSDHGRLLIAGVTALIGLGAIGVAIWETTTVLFPASKSLSDFVGDPAMKKIFDENFELLNGYGKNLAQFEIKYRAAREAYVGATEPAEEEKAKEAFYAFAPTVERIMNEGLLVTITRRFIRARRFMVASAFVAGVCIIAFTWAANPPSATPKPKAGADQLTAVSHGVGVQVAATDAIALLSAQGVDNAGAVVASFSGGLELRTVGTHDNFFRYTTTAHDGGSYLTRLSFSGPTTARLALHLPFADTAACRQTVTAVKRTLVLEGQLAGGRPGNVQLFTIHPSDFNSTSAVSYSPEPCAPS